MWETKPFEVKAYKDLVLMFLLFVSRTLVCVIHEIEKNVEGE